MTSILILFSFALVTAETLLLQDRHALLHPEVHKKIERRSAHDSDEFVDFVEDKLIRHGQALEELVKSTKVNEEVNRRMLQYLSNHVDKPKPPQKVYTALETRRSNMPIIIDNREEDTFSRMGKNIPKYGSLFSRLMMRNLNDNGTAPVGRNDELDEHLTRRSTNPGPVTVNSPNDPMVSKEKWCQESVLCQKTYQPICGFDDKFGYGKFVDFCHMLQVNCYWKYNFAIVPSCNPYF